MNTPTCPKCGGELPVGVPLVLCPKCLLAEGVEGAETLSVSGEQTLAVPASDVVLAPGQLPVLGQARVELYPHGIRSMSLRRQVLEWLRVRLRLSPSIRLE